MAAAPATNAPPTDRDTRALLTECTETAREVYQLAKRLQASENRWKEALLKMERLERFLGCIMNRNPYTCRAICRTCGESFEQEAQPGDLCPSTNCYGRLDVVLSYND